MSRREHRLKSAFRRFLGGDAIDDLISARAVRHTQKEIVCCAANLFDFDSLCLSANLDQVARTLDGYYAQIADAVMQSGGDVYWFGGATIVSFYGSLLAVDDKQTLLATAVTTLSTARMSIEESFGVRVGVGICSGNLIYGSYGSSNRMTATAFGPALACAKRLAESADGISLCERLISATDSQKVIEHAAAVIRPHSGTS